MLGTLTKQDAVKSNIGKYPTNQHRLLLPFDTIVFSILFSASGVSLTLKPTSTRVCVQFL